NQAPRTAVFLIAKARVRLLCGRLPASLLHGNALPAFALHFLPDFFRRVPAESHAVAVGASIHAGLCSFPFVLLWRFCSAVPAPEFHAKDMRELIGARQRPCSLPAMPALDPAASSKWSQACKQAASDLR